MKTILVVDDEPSFVTAVELTLAASGYDIMTAASGEEALVAINSRVPNLILLDIMMPGLSGLETLKLLKAHPNFKKIPVILVSAAHPLSKQSEAGWTEFVQKPFDLDKLLSLIKKHVK